MSSIACGIDFGTSNCLAAVVQEGRVAVCPVDPVNTDPHLLPSLIYFSRYHRHRVGRAATHAYQKDPDGRFLRALKSGLAECGPEEYFRMFRESFNLPGFIGLVLREIRARLEEQLGQEVRAATLGRPVRFSPDPEVDRRAEEMLRAGAESAGFRTVRFVTEPEAATRYFFWTAGERAESTVLVFDFGGGTLDLCLARFGRHGYRVLNTAGVRIGGTMLDRILFEKKLLHHLGKGQRWGRGLDLPHHIFNRLVNPDDNWRLSDVEYARMVQSILNTSVAWGGGSPQLRTFHRIVSRRLGPDLFAEIERAKMRLSGAEATEIRFESEDVRISEPLDREDLRRCFAGELQAIRELVLRTLAEAGSAPRDVDRVVLAGGSSALVCTQELLKELFGEERVPARQDLFTSIVSGLALDAAGMAVEPAIAQGG